MAGNEVDVNEKLLQIAKYNNKGQFEKAIKEYKQLLASYRNDAKILNSMGDTYAKMQGENDNALRCYDQSADQYAKDGIWPTAIAILKKMLRMRPEKLDTKFKIADFCIQMKSFNEAEQYLIEYAEYYITAGDVQKAIPAYERVASISPDNMERKIKLAELYFFTGNTDKMLTTYQAVFNYYKAQKNVTKTQEIFNSITAISNKNQLLMTATYFSIFLGYIEFLLNDTQDDERAISTAMDMVTRVMESGDLDKAQSLCTKIIELRPDAVNVRFKLIDIHDKSGDRDSLIDAYVSIGSYFSDRDISRAEVLFKKVLQLDPSNPDAKAFFGTATSSAPVEQSEKAQVIEDDDNEDIDTGTAVIEGGSDIIQSSQKHTDDAENFVDRDGLGITSTFDETSVEKDLGTLDLTQVQAEDDDFKKKLSQDITFTPAESIAQEVPEFSPDEINDFSNKKETKKKAVVETRESETSPVTVSHDDDDDIEIEIEIDDDDVVTVAASGDKKPEKSQSQASETVSQTHEDIDDKLGSMFTEFAAPAEQGLSLLSEISDHESEFVPNLDAIVQDFKRGLEAQLEGDPQAHCDMGTSFLSMGMIDEAMDEFRKLTSIANYKYRSHDGLAQCLLAREEYDAAIEEYFIILEFPNLTQDEMDATHFNLARTFYKKGDLIESKRYLILIQQQDLFSKSDEYRKMQDTFKKELLMPNDGPIMTIDSDGDLTPETEEESSIIGDVSVYDSGDLELGNEVQVESLDPVEEEAYTVETSGIESGALIDGVAEVVESNERVHEVEQNGLHIQSPFESNDSSVLSDSIEVQHTPHIEESEPTINIIETRVPVDATFSLKGQEKLESEINKLRKEILSAKDAVAGSSEKWQVTAESIKSLEQEIHDVRETLQDIVQFKDSVSDIGDVVGSMKEKIDTAIADVAGDITARLDAFEVKDSKITSDIEQLKTDMEGYRDLSVREKEILNQFMKYREDFDAFADEISGMKEMVKKGQMLESRIDEIAQTLERVTDIEKKIDDLTQSVDSIAMLEERVARIETALQRVQDTQSDTMQSSQSDIAEEQEKVRREVVSLKTLIHDIDSKVYMLEMRSNEEPRQTTMKKERNTEERPMRADSFESSSSFEDRQIPDVLTQDEPLYEEDVAPKPKKQTRKNKKDKISFL